MPSRVANFYVYILSVNPKFAGLSTDWLREQLWAGGRHREQRRVDHHR
ncbi:MAG TPA: hypothetical protein VIX59_14290 [Candidatus Binataceae bacterium]